MNSKNNFPKKKTKIEWLRKYLLILLLFYLLETR